MRFPILTLVGALVALVASAANLPTPHEVVTHVRPLVPTIALSAPTDWRHSLAGHYEPAKRLSTPRIPELSGDDLYLFPDKTYIYIEWTDISPETIDDKGAWSFDGQFVRLLSDRSVPKHKGGLRDMTFIPLTATYARKTRLLLMGVPRDFRYFKEESPKERDLGDFMFLLYARVRGKAIDDRSAPKLKARLMRQSWRPDFFSR